MYERSKTISRLRSDLNARASYIKAKLGVLVPSQIKALRLKSNMPRQADLARQANMQQSRISLFETPGAANMTIETLSRLAAAFNVGLIVEFVPFSDMLEWENSFSQDSFDVVRLEQDHDFLQDRPREIRRRSRRHRRGCLAFIGDSQSALGAALTIAASAQLSLFNSPSHAMGQPRQFVQQRTELGRVFAKWLDIGRTAEGKGSLHGTEQTARGSAAA